MDPSSFVDPKYAQGGKPVDVGAFRAKWQRALNELQAEADRLVVEAGGDPLNPVNPHAASIRRTHMLTSFDTAKDSCVKWIFATARAAA
jgi:hypothetical protein